MFLLRSGPRVVTLHTDYPDEVKRRLLGFPSAELCTLHEGLDRADEESVLCLVDPEAGAGRIDFERLHAIVLINDEVSSFLVDLSSLLSEAAVSDGLRLVERLALGPTVVLMRSTGNPQTMIERLTSRLGGITSDFDSAIAEGERSETVIAITSGPLNVRLGSSELYPTVLRVGQPGIRVLDILHSEALVLITENLESHEWYELRINIYDSSQQYELHYERLKTVLSGLDLGLVLGERWTEDHALALMSVLAFQVHLFTLVEPSGVKEILVGLEYDDSGNRLVDMDLYYRNRKVTWAAASKRLREEKASGSERGVRRKRRWHLFSREETETGEPEPKGEKTHRRDKQRDALACREALIRRLPPKSAEKLLELERTLR